jgi:hypothetical protein
MVVLRTGRSCRSDDRPTLRRRSYAAARIGPRAGIWLVLRSALDEGHALALILEAAERLPAAVLALSLGRRVVGGVVEHNAAVVEESHPMTETQRRTRRSRGAKPGRSRITLPSLPRGTSAALRPSSGPRLILSGLETVSPARNAMSAG